MHTSAFNEKMVRDNSLLTVVVVLVLLTVVSCSHGTKEKANHDNLPQREEFHADNDIAMTIRSLADAIRVGEPLDSTQYDFLGVLTDGQGAPIYTDVQGAPGEWVIDVIDKGSVSLKNVYLGDLLPKALETYILESLSLTNALPLEFESHDAETYDDTSIELYDFGGGYLRFETRSGIAPNGVEGPLLTIILSADPPAGTQTASTTQSEATP